MKRQRLLFAAAAAGLAIVAVASMQITTSSTAYCAPKDRSRSGYCRKPASRRRASRRRDADFRRPLRELPSAGRRRQPKKRARPHHLCRRHEGHQVRAHGHPGRSGEQQSDAAARLARVAGSAHAARQEAAVIHVTATTSAPGSAKAPKTIDRLIIGQMPTGYGARLFLRALVTLQPSTFRSLITSSRRRSLSGSLASARRASAAAACALSWSPSTI